MAQTEPDLSVDVTDVDVLPRLSYDEDAELRRLEFISQVGSLAEHKQARLLELRARDRRSQVRSPRETVVERVDSRRRRRFDFHT